MELEVMTHCFVQEKIWWKKYAMKTNVQHWDHGQNGPNVQLLVVEVNVKETETAVCLNQEQINTTIHVR